MQTPPAGAEAWATPEVGVGFGQRQIQGSCSFASYQLCDLTYLEFIYEITGIFRGRNHDFTITSNGFSWEKNNLSLKNSHKGYMGVRQTLREGVKNDSILHRRLIRSSGYLWRERWRIKTKDSIQVQGNQEKPASSGQAQQSPRLTHSCKQARNRGRDNVHGTAPAVCGKQFSGEQVLHVTLDVLGRCYLALGMLQAGAWLCSQEACSFLHTSLFLKQVTQASCTMGSHDIAWSPA